MINGSTTVNWLGIAVDQHDHQVVDAFLELDTSRRGTIRLHELRDVLSRFDIPDQVRWRWREERLEFSFCWFVVDSFFEKMWQNPKDWTIL